jgi:uncharacterized membrane protein
MKSFLSLPVGSKIIVTVFLLSGIGHLVNPAAFASLVPPFLPEPYFWIYATGVAEIICAIGLLIRNKLAPISTVALLLSVGVGNWWFAIDMSQNGELSTIIAAWVRVPLQLPLLWWAYKSPVKQ